MAAHPAQHIDADVGCPTKLRTTRAPRQANASNGKIVERITTRSWSSLLQQDSRRLSANLARSHAASARHAHTAPRAIARMQHRRNQGRRAIPLGRTTVGSPLRRRSNEHALLADRNPMAWLAIGTRRRAGSSTPGAPSCRLGRVCRRSTAPGLTSSVLQASGAAAYGCP